MLMANELTKALDFLMLGNPAIIHHRLTIYIATLTIRCKVVTAHCISTPS